MHQSNPSAFRNHSSTKLCELLDLQMHVKHKVVVHGDGALSGLDLVLLGLRDLLYDEQKRAAVCYDHEKKCSQERLKFIASVVKVEMALASSEIVQQVSVLALEWTQWSVANYSSIVEWFITVKNELDKKLRQRDNSACEESVFKHLLYVGEQLTQVLFRVLFSNKQESLFSVQSLLFQVDHKKVIKKVFAEVFACFCTNWHAMKATLTADDSNTVAILTELQLAKALVAYPNSFDELKSQLTSIQITQSRKQIMQEYKQERIHKAEKEPEIAKLKSKLEEKYESIVQEHRFKFMFYDTGVPLTKLSSKTKGYTFDADSPDRVSLSFDKRSLIELEDSEQCTIC
ncbi:hypothetical protein Ciccas_010690 [Cichlidogyrus casuarinus]|uniref:Uncharacterized protein n=1 Tax=Cichlidogyrus casuarinus TaxID=1844966 RepID=A0ABD2PUK7_9PLAT